MVLGFSHPQNGHFYLASRMSLTLSALGCAPPSVGRQKRTHQNQGVYGNCTFPDLRKHLVGQSTGSVRDLVYVLARLAPCWFKESVAQEMA